MFGDPKRPKVTPALAREALILTRRFGDTEEKVINLAAVIILQNFYALHHGDGRKANPYILTLGRLREHPAEQHANKNWYCDGKLIPGAQVARLAKRGLVEVEGIGMSITDLGEMTLNLYTGSRYSTAA